MLNMRVALEYVTNDFTAIITKYLLSLEVLFLDDGRNIRSTKKRLHIPQEPFTLLFLTVLDNFFRKNELF